MQRNYDNSDWMVRSDGENFYLTEGEMEAVKKALASNQRYVWFGSFLISVRHISWAREIDHPRLLEEGTQDLPKISEEKRKENSKKFREMKSKIFVAKEK